MNTENNVALDDAFEAVVKTHQIYAQDAANIMPVIFFIEAFQNFHKKLAADPESERFAESRKFFNKFNERVTELEENASLSDVWRMWEQGVRAVELYDAREKARVTPPTLSIDELVANGVSERVIAKIYGFYDANGRPDLDAVRERRPWVPAPKQSALTPEQLAEIQAAKEKAAEANAANGISEEPEPAKKSNNDAAPLLATTASKPGPKPKSAKQIEAEVRANIKTSLDAEIEAGIAPRQIAAKHGCSVEDVKKRAEEMAAIKKAETAAKNAKDEK